MNFLNGSFFRCCGRVDDFPNFGWPEVVFVGRSNVGKSSLINRILNRKRIAKISSKPGKTATVNFYDVENCFLVDLPGYGYAKISKKEKQKWADLTNSYFFGDRKILMVVLVIDCRRGLCELDRQMISLLKGRRFIIVLNKADKLKKSQQESVLSGVCRSLKGFDCFEVLMVSTKTFQGLQELKCLILNSFEG